MINLTPFIDCARRLGHDPVTVLGPMARARVVSRNLRGIREPYGHHPRGVRLAIVDTPEGPAYRFA